MAKARNVRRNLDLLLRADGPGWSLIDARRGGDVKDTVASQRPAVCGEITRRSKPPSELDRGRQRSAPAAAGILTQKPGPGDRGGWIQKLQKHRRARVVSMVILAASSHTPPSTATPPPCAVHGTGLAPMGFSGA